MYVCNYVIVQVQYEGGWIEFWEELMLQAKRSQKQKKKRQGWFW